MIQTVSNSKDIVHAAGVTGFIAKPSSDDR
jgi:hypothetical protein